MTSLLLPRVGAQCQVGREPGSAGELASELGPDGLAGLSRNSLESSPGPPFGWHLPPPLPLLPLGPQCPPHTLQPRGLCPAVPSAPHSSLTGFGVCTNVTSSGKLPFPPNTRSPPHLTVGSLFLAEFSSLAPGGHMVTCRGHCHLPMGGPAPRGRRSGHG